MEVDQHSSRSLSLLVLLFPLLLSGCGLFFSAEEPDEGEIPETAYAIARTARAQVGVPYRPGGTSRKGFDCSGLVQFCYHQHGINLPRTASDQADCGRSIAVEKAREGDLLVFSPGWFSTHTGICVGGGYFVHAPGKGRRVELCRLDARHWQKMLSQVRRLVP